MIVSLAILGCRRCGLTRRVGVRLSWTDSVLVVMRKWIDSGTSTDVVLTKIGQAPLALSSHRARRYLHLQPTRFARFSIAQDLTGAAALMPVGWLRSTRGREHVTKDIGDTGSPGVERRIVWVRL